MVTWDLGFVGIFFLFVTKNCETSRLQRIDVIESELKLGFHIPAGVSRIT